MNRSASSRRKTSTGSPSGNSGQRASSMTAWTIGAHVRFRLPASPAARDPGWRPKGEGRALDVFRDDRRSWIGDGIPSRQIHVSIHDVDASWPHEPTCTPTSGLHGLKAEPEALPSSAVRPDQAERPPVQVPRAVAAFDGERLTPDARHGTARPAIPLVPSCSDCCVAPRIQR